MKKFYFMLMAVMAVMLFACSQQEVTPPQADAPEANGDGLTEKEAIKMANDYFKLSKANDWDYEVSYILNEDAAVSRSSSLPDTLAYVLNRPQNDGFMVIANTTEQDPVLAFADEGHFSYEETDEDIVYNNFVLRIGDYISDAFDPTLPLDSGIVMPQQPTSIYPRVHAHLKQRSPYDTYVIIEHPRCPVGCVAVATAIIMSHTRETLEDYHGEDFSLYQMICAYSPWQISDILSRQMTSIYTLPQAQDRFAKLLYYIGQDVHMDYDWDGSAAYSIDAFRLLKNLGFNIYEEHALRTYNIYDVTCALMADYLIYMRGTDTNGAGGHAWVIDGARWNWIQLHPGSRSSDDEIPTPLINNMYVHCEWGWGGNSNGYYNANVFSAGSYNFGSMQFFSVKIEDPDLY